MTEKAARRTVRRVALLTNPQAGRGSAVAAADAARERFARRGVDVVSIQGATPESSRGLAERAVRGGGEDGPVDALVACGGDGLVGLALQAQAGSGVPLGIVPAGTGNDHAREFGIPLDPRRAADVVADGWTESTDLGRMRRWVSGDAADGTEERWFGTIACAGFDSLVSDRTNRIAWPRGRARYNLAIVLEFLNFHSIPTRLVLDPGDPGERVLEENMTLVAMGNTRSYGGGMLICPRADHADGVLEVTVLERMNRFRAAVKFGRIFTGDFLDERGISTYRARRVLVDMPDGGRGTGGGPISGYADGERFGPLPMEVEAVPGAGLFLVPGEARGA